MKFQKNTNNGSNKLTIVLFIIYLIALFWIILFKLGVQFSYMENRIVNFIPFGGGKLDKSDIMWNVVIFVPLGIYTGVLFKGQTMVTKFFYFFLISSMFEVLQFIFRIGAFDITDIITNTAGAIIGLSLFNAIEILFKNSVNAQKFINTFAAIGTILMISLLFLLKMNMLPIRYQ